MARSRKSKRKKPVTEPEPPEEKPPIEPTTTEYKDKWNNGNHRTLKAGETDPDDPKLKLLKVGDIAPIAVIDGKGVCTVSGSSPRLYFSVPNTDVEMSAEVLVENDLEIAHLVVRSNHEDRPDGHGGNYLYVSMKDQLAYFKVEETHEKGYSPRLKETKINFDKNKWHKMVMSAKTEGSNVRLKGSFDDINIEYLNTGIKGTPFIGQGKWCFIRTNKPNGVKYRNVVIREI